jgi:hypothetical protein
MTLLASVRDDCLFATPRYDARVAGPMRRSMSRDVGQHWDSAVSLWRPHVKGSSEFCRLGEKRNGGPIP